MDLSSSLPRSRTRIVAIVLSMAVGAGCASTGRDVVDPVELEEAIAALSRPMTGDLAALYDLRVARSGGLRLAVLTDGDEGRLTISEPFGSAVSLTAWSGRGPAMFFDMDEGCRREVDDLEEVLGVGTLPFSEAVRLLGGRLPVMSGDELEVGAGGRVDVHGVGWAARLRLDSQPWRVVEVRELRADGGTGWNLELSSHTSSVPGSIRLVNPDGRWAELELKRLEWPEEAMLPDLPAFPPCRGW